MIAARASMLPPSKVAFLLVDYKGGAAFRECVDLPHAVGLVTDLDHQLARRVLASLDAPGKRRESPPPDPEAQDLARLSGRVPPRPPPTTVLPAPRLARPRPAQP